MSIHQSLFNYINESSLIIQVTWIMSAFFMVVIIPLTFYFRYLRMHLRKQERTVALYEQKYESYLINYLYSGNEQEIISPEQQVIINQLKKSTSESYKRKILISVLIKLQNEISGEIAESIQTLYFHSGLMQYALNRLNHKKWYVIAKGIRELKQFHIKEAYDQVILHINHPRREVRKEMQLYMVSLFHFEGLKFLELLETPLSEWDQIQLLGVLERLESKNISNIKLWLRSNNKSVVFFALKLAKIYNQFECKEEIINLLNHINKKVRLESIQVLSYLDVIEAKEILKENIEKRTLEEQIAFFKMMENLYEKSDESFIINFIHSEVFEIKVSSLKILKILNKDKFTKLKVEFSNPDFLKIINFLENN
ncbi:hypothetical protein [Flavobacterium sp. GP15]|uniref:hypothetical protein n=1 Tax=Flavobacterium sp. GP15 TaxID=2758567 RepID=UPI00165D4EB7|nr:hypothetical protein [Flavobacterium sp. GP15]